MSKEKNIANDIRKLDAYDIYEAHMQCETPDFLIDIIEEGLIRLKKDLGSNKARLIIRGLIKDLYDE